MNSPITNIAIEYDPQRPSYSQQLAAELGLAVCDDPSKYPFLVKHDDNGLFLQQTGVKAAGPVRVDFVSGAIGHRRKHGGSELVVKAVGGLKRQLPSVVDATAGLGRDSFVLAARGYQVTLCERSSVISALLVDGLSRAEESDDEELRGIVARMSLRPEDSIQYLQGLSSDNAGVILIDPMFPESKKSALVKKEMRAFHSVVGADEDSAQLLQCALDVAKYRVVVKRPKKAEFLGGKKPNFEVAGKAIRFDIYSLRTFGK